MHSAKEVCSFISLNIIDLLLAIYGRAQPFIDFAL